MVWNPDDIEDRKKGEQERERLRQVEADLAHVNGSARWESWPRRCLTSYGNPSPAAITTQTRACVGSARPPGCGRGTRGDDENRQGWKSRGEIIDRLRSFYKKVSTRT